MAVMILDGMVTGGPGNPDTLNLDKFPAGHLCAALNFRFAVPMTSSGNQTGDAADLQAIMLMAIGSLTIKDGTGHVAYPTVPGDELRHIHRLMNLNEVPNDIIGTAFTAATDYTVHFDLRLRFGFPWLARPDAKLPGASQMRKVSVELVEGSTVPAGWTRDSGNIIIDVDVETIESNTDQYAPMLSYFRDNQSRLYAQSPDGLIVAAWDANAAYASTAIDLFTVAVGREESQLRKPYMVADAFSDGVIQGGDADISDSVTPLYMPTRNVDPDALPHGRLTVRLASQYVSTIKLRGLFFPAITSEAAGTATVQATELAKTAVNGSVAEAGVDGAHAGSASVRPIRFYPASRPEFTLRPGLIAQKDATTVSVSVPKSYRESIGGAVAEFAKAGATTAQAAKANAARQLGDLLPGFTTPDGGKAQGLLSILGL